MQTANEMTTKIDSIIDHALTHYEAAKNRLDDAMRLLGEARNHASSAGYSYYLSNMRYGLDVNQANRELTIAVWRNLIRKTGIVTLMDSQTREKMDDDLQKNPMELTRENIKNILFDLYQRKDTILAGSLINVFRQLSRQYKSNDQIKLTGNRVVIYIGKGWGRDSRYTDKLTDLDRILHFFDGAKEPTAHKETLGYRVAWSEEPEIENNYLRVKTFKNGNAHVFFKRKDLIKQCNRLIAYHHKNQLGQT